MKIEYTNGCTTDRIEIEGEDFDNLSAWKMGVVKDKVVGFLNATELTEVNLQDLISWISDRYGATEHIGICESCGDSIYKTTLNI